MPCVALCGPVVNFAGLLHIEKEARKMAQMQVWTTVEMTNFNAKMIGLPILCQICVYNAKKAEGAKKKKKKS